MINEETQAIIDAIGAWQFWTLYAIAMVLTGACFAWVAREFILNIEDEEEEI